ncbi:protein toll [Bicyclus anynana]|uniref:Protein toll n=1 Tax=Bicyclus anynana TaxID=110368 RepID=A0ABM3M3Z7_BICAN|nr:protein toll [Bicyclus anynana]
MCARLLLLVAAVAAVADDPSYSLVYPHPADGCTAADVSGGRRAECTLRAGRVTLHADADATTLQLICDDERSFSCAELAAAAPLLAPQRPGGGTLKMLKISNCALPAEPLRCVAALLGAQDAALLWLQDVRGSLRPQHVRGLRAVERLSLYYADGENCTSVPYSALALLPALRRFTMRRGALVLGGPGAPLGGLRALELAVGALRALPARAFADTPALQSLALWSNSIDSVHGDALAGLSSLVNLSLNSNQLETLPERLFRPTPRLQRLDLYDNRLQTLPAGLLQGLQHLTHVLIFENKATLQLSPRLFSNLPALEHLELKTSSIHTLPADLFLNTTNIQELYLSGNQLTSIPEGIFQGFVRLKTLDLSRNKLEAVHKGVLSQLKVLENLDLRGNKLKVLHEEVFAGLEGLKVLHLGDNLLEALDPLVFHGLSALRQLYLPGNRIQVLHKETFRPVRGLETLDLSSNNLSISRQVNTQHFMSTELHAQYMLDNSSVPVEQGEYHSPLRELRELVRLDLRHNRVRLLCDDWRGLLRLRQLQLAHNHLTELKGIDMEFLSTTLKVDLTHNRIAHFEPFATASATFQLDHNPFVCDCELYPFADMQLRHTLPKGIEINNAECADPPLLRHTRLADLHPDQLSCAASPCNEGCSCEHRPARNRTDVNCVELPANLTFNPNTRLRLTRLTDLTKLPPHVKYLDLSALNLTEIPKITQPIEIDLTDNHLNAIPIDLLKLNCIIHFSNNPIGCTCNNKLNLEFLKQNNHLVRDYYNLTCDNDLLLSGLDTDSLCTARDSTIIGCTIAFIGVFIAVATAIAYRYKTLIRIVLRKIGLWRVEEEIDDKLYDAFISFSHQDEAYVIDTLVPKLESGVRPLKLCLHYRDWVIGDFIPSQISKSVETSRRTIIVLSEHFLKSVWAQMEFRAAHGRERLLILMLEDLSKCKDLDPDLRAYISVNTYVKADDPLVFDRLKDAVLTKTRNLVKPPKNVDNSPKIVDNTLKIVDNVTKIVDNSPKIVDKPTRLDVTLVNGQLVNNALPS